MASTTTSNIMVKAPQPELMKAVRKWWEELAYDDKKVRLDILPSRFWGTFTHKDEGEGSEQVVQVYASIESGTSLRDFDLGGGGGYGRNLIKISCLIPDPNLETRASDYLDQFIEWVDARFSEMGISVEVPEVERAVEEQGR
jgi:hypothetical protein